MWHAGLDETQSGIKIAFRNINNLRYTDDTTFMAEIEEDLKSFSMQVKEESKKAVLKLSIQKLCHGSGSVTSWQIDGETNGNTEKLYFLGLQNQCRPWLQPWN